MKNSRFLIALLGFILFTGFSQKTERTEYQYNHDLLELPRINSGETILVYSSMIIKYDCKHLVPSWVAYELTSNETQGEVPRAKSFSMDMQFNSLQAMREDYSGSGWDRGHMAPAADMKWSELAMRECFYLTNICPQNHELNAGDWLSLEKWCRDKAVKFNSLYIVTGPLFVSGRYGVIGDNKVVVPDKFFKAILAKSSKGDYHSIAFIMENSSKKQSLKSSSCSVNYLEKSSGIDFFVNLPDSIEEKIESENNYSFW